MIRDSHAQSTTESAITDPVWLALLAMVGTSIAATVTGILTLIKANETLARSNESFAKSGESLATSRLAAEALLALARCDAEALLVAARLRAAEKLQRAADASAEAAGPLLRANTVAPATSPASVEANTRAVKGSEPG